MCDYIRQYFSTRDLEHLAEKFISITTYFHKATFKKYSLDETSLLFTVNFNFDP